MRASPSVRGPAKQFNSSDSSKPPIADTELRMRAAASLDGSARLASAINALVLRTAGAIAIPSEHEDRRLEFARSYLGMEVNE
jgi:hypothetical protein